MNLMLLTDFVSMNFLFKYSRKSMKKKNQHKIMLSCIIETKYNKSNVTIKQTMAVFVVLENTKIS